MKECWGLLDLTSRSFAMVVKELEGDLARIVSPSDNARDEYYGGDGEDGIIIC